MKLIIQYFLLLISTIMFFLNHPLSMGLMILIQTLLISMFMGILIKTYWFSYILFLVFLGGLLVLFIYVSSVASNEKFKLNFKWMIIMMMMFFIIFFTLKKNIFFYENLEMINYFNLYFFNNTKMNLFKFYNTQSFYIMILMIIYLFITLIAIVKITNIYYGPIRSYMN